VSGLQIQRTGQPRYLIQGVVTTHTPCHRLVHEYLVRRLHLARRRDWGSRSRFGLHGLCRALAVHRVEIPFQMIPQIKTFEESRHLKESRHLFASCCRGGARGLFPRARPRACAAAFGIQLAVAPVSCPLGRRPRVWHPLGCPPPPFFSPPWPPPPVFLTPLDFAYFVTRRCCVFCFWPAPSRAAFALLPTSPL
jgi:hypothetical protein